MAPGLMPAEESDHAAMLVTLDGQRIARATGALVVDHADIRHEKEFQARRLEAHEPVKILAMQEIALVERSDLLQGTPDLLVLETLQWGPQHGYGISQAIRLHSSDVLQVDTGSLYPALHRLERQGFVRAEWTVSENRQRARVYRLTVAGRRQLATERSRWDQLTEAIAGVLTRRAGRLA